MKKKILTILSVILIVFSAAACSNGEPGRPDNNEKPQTRDITPSGIWVLRYAADENGDYVQDYNIIDDYDFGEMSFIEKDIYDYGYLTCFRLDESGKGTFTDFFDKIQNVAFEGNEIKFENGYKTTYRMKGDLMVFKEENREYYDVMENVSEKLYEQIKRGAFECVELNKAEIGDLIGFGEYDIWPYNDQKEVIRWRVIYKKGDDLLVLCDRLIDAFSYNHNPELRDLDSITWENCSLRAFLNDPEGFLSCFTKEESDMIRTAHLENKAANKELMKYWGDFVDQDEKKTFSDLAVQDLNDENDTDDKVFLLSFQEVEKYFGTAEEPYDGNSDYPYNAMPSSSKWKAGVTPSVDYNLSGAGYYDMDTLNGAWMTRTLSTDHHNEKMVTYITSEGQVFNYFTHTPMFIRPAMWIHTGN